MWSVCGVRDMTVLYCRWIYEITADGCKTSHDGTADELSPPLPQIVELVLSVQSYICKLNENVNGWLMGVRTSIINDCILLLVMVLTTDTQTLLVCIGT